MVRTRSRTGGAVSAGVVLIAILGSLMLAARANMSAAQPSQGRGEIVLTCAPGTVLTKDGTIWVYRPDRKEWLTIDQSFAESDGRKTKVLPLPVPADNIADMASFGFIVTRSGSCWLYDLEKDQWRDVGAPSRRP